MWHCEHISLMKKSLPYLCIFIMNTKRHFTKKWAIFLKNLNRSKFEPNVILCKIWYLDNTTLYCATKHAILNGGNNIQVWNTHFLRKIIIGHILMVTSKIASLTILLLANYNIGEKDKRKKKDTKWQNIIIIVSDLLLHGSVHNYLPAENEDFE